MNRKKSGTASRSSSGRDEGKVQLGQRIRTLRKRLGLTQEELAEKVGLDGKYLAEIERAEPRANPTVSALSKIASGLGVSLQGLFAETTRSAEGYEPQALRRELDRVVSEASPRRLYDVLRVARYLTGKEG